MFEKEAEEFKKQIQQEYLDLGKNGAYPPLWERIGELWGKGAEFGYNKASEDFAKQLKEVVETCNHWQEVAEKANEWHFVKDELPEKEKYVLVYTKLENVYVARLVKDNYFINKNGGFVQTSSVVAWKEIVLPELKESE